MGLNRICLDAPIVTGLWWFLFGRQFGETMSWKVGAALCCAVWAIYLLDRLLDYSADKKNIPLRKQLSAKDSACLRILAGVAICAAIVLGVQTEKLVWLQAGLIGALTALYFLLFRKLGKRTKFPAKEFLIGFCFAGGVGLPFAWPVNQLKLGGLIVLGALCTLNCLIISQAEAEHDQESDPSAWFSNSNRSFPFTTTLSIALLGTMTLLFIGLPPTTGGCLITSTMLLWVILIYHQRLAESIQTTCDAALWLPPLIGIAVLLF